MSISEKNRKKAGKSDASREEDEDAIRTMRAEFQNSEEEPAEVKKSYRKLLIVAAAVLIVGIGAGGAWMFLLQPDEEVAEIVEVEPEIVPRAYVPTQPVHISFVQNDGRQRRLVVYLKLEVADEEGNVAAVKDALPRLQEAFWRSLNGVPLPGADTGAIELKAVKQRVRAESDRLLGPHIVSDVLIRDARLVRG